MSYCKTQLINELKNEVVKVKSTYVPPEWDGQSFNTWAREIILKQPPPKELRKVSEQY